MLIGNWRPYLKFDDLGQYRCMAQQTYEPLINPEGTVFCANYDWKNKYQRRESDRPGYTENVVDFFWNKEVESLLAYKDKPYAPELIDIDYTNKRIFFKWYGKSCNEIIYSKEDLSDVSLNWRDQIASILLDLHNSGTYKLTMYSHCHMIDNHGQMRAFDWYGCMPVSDPLIDSVYMNAIIHGTALHRIKEVVTQDGKYDLGQMFKRSLGNYVRWGSQNLVYVYRQMFNEEPSSA